MRDGISKCLHNQMSLLCQHFGQSEGLVFGEILTTERLDEIVEDEIGVYRHRIYPPVVTVSAMISQVLSEDHSCRDAVARVLADRVADGERACSSDTGGYCKARSRLPEAVLSRLMTETGVVLDEQSKREWLWQDRVVKLIDGTTVTMPDTPKNQASDPQPDSQQAGLGFPIVRLVGVLSLSSGAVLNVGFGPYQGKQSGEQGLLRPMRDSFSVGDVVLGDSYYGTYWLLASLQQRQADGVFEVHGSRSVQFKPGVSDQVVVWNKPRQRPEWMDKATRMT